MYILITISIISILISYIINHLIITGSIFKESVTERLSTGRAEEVIINRYKYEWVRYLLTPILKFIPIITISLIILTGAYLNNYKVKFVKILKLVTILNAIQLLPGIIRIVWFNNSNNFTLEEFQNFSPYSLLYYLNKDNFQVWLYYPLSLVNILEILYWVLLTIGIKKIFKIRLSKAICLFFQTYFIALLLWVTFVTFIIIILD